MRAEEGEGEGREMEGERGEREGERISAKQPLLPGLIIIEQYEITYWNIVKCISYNG